MQIIPKRLERIQSISLKRGDHTENAAIKACVMEAVAYVAGEPWSDRPACACPVITTFMIAWNDGLPNDIERDRLLKPLIPLIVGTRSTPAVEERRSYMALDWLIRVYTPKWLDLVPSLQSHAKALRDLDEIADVEGAIAAGTKVSSASKDAAAARDAAWAAAGAALKPTTAWLQTSALDLVRRMFAVEAA